MRVFLFSLFIGYAITSCGMFEDKKDDVEIIYVEPKDDDKEQEKEDNKDEVKVEVTWEKLAQVINAKCIGCHQTQQPKLLPKAQFDKVKDKAIGAVLSGKMPPKGPLSDAEKALFEGYKG